MQVLGWVDSAPPHDSTGPDRLKFDDLVERKGLCLGPRKTSSNHDQDVAFEQMWPVNDAYHGAEASSRNGVPKSGGGGQDVLIVSRKFHPLQKAAKIPLDIGRRAQQAIGGQTGCWRR